MERWLDRGMEIWVDTGMVDGRDGGTGGWRRTQRDIGTATQTDG